MENFTHHTVIKMGDILTFLDSDTGRQVYGIVNNRRFKCPTSLGKRNLIFLSTGLGLEYFGTRREFVKRKASILSPEELVWKANDLLRALSSHKKALR